MALGWTQRDLRYELDRAHDAWRTRANSLSDTLKVTIMMGQYMLEKHRGNYYAKAQDYRVGFALLTTIRSHPAICC